MSLFTQIFCNRVALVSVFAFVFSSCCFAGCFDRCGVMSSSDVQRISVYMRDQLLALHLWLTIDPTVSALIGQLGIQLHSDRRGRRHQARGRRAGTRVQRRITILSCDVNMLPISNHERLRTLAVACSDVSSSSLNAKPNLAIPRTIRPSKPTARTLRCRSLNIHSMRNKLDDVDNLIRDHHLHILAVTETWHEHAECISIKRLRCVGYNVIEAARLRPVRSVDEDIDYINHCGIAFVSRPGILVTKLDLKFRLSTFEYMCCRVTVL